MALVKLCSACERKKAMPKRDLCFECDAKLEDELRALLNGEPK